MSRNPKLQHKRKILVFAKVSAFALLVILTLNTAFAWDFQFGYTGQNTNQLA
jgi:hypothetical protein